MQAKECFCGQKWARHDHEYCKSYMNGDAPRYVFDRVEHNRRAGQKGGMATFLVHGTAHMRAIGTAGAKVTRERHGVGYLNGILKSKGWSGKRRGNVRHDLFAGHVYGSW